MKFGRKTGLQGEAGPASPSDEPVASRSESGSPRAKIGGSSKSQRRSNKRGYLDGQMLIAMPTMGDERFARSVIYVCAHSPEGAMGIIVNQPAPNISFSDLLLQLEVVGTSDLIELPQQADGIHVLRGGPVET